MLHERLLEIVARHVELLDKVREGGMDFGDVLKFYAVLHALQIHAQAAADYLLHTCAVLGISTETPISCITHLLNRGFISAEEADVLKRMVRFRNIIVHGYSAVDPDKVAKVIETRGYFRILSIIYKLHSLLKAEGLLDP